MVESWQVTAIAPEVWATIEQEAARKATDGVCSGIVPGERSLTDPHASRDVWSWSIAPRPVPLIPRLVEA